MSNECVGAIGRAMGTYLARVAQLKAPKIVVGRDIRPSSERIREALIEALVSSGVIDLSPITECKVIHSLTIMEAKKSVFIFNIKD